MEHKSHIAEIGLGTLVSAGLRSFVRGDRTMEFESFDRFEDFYPVSSKYDIYVISAGVFSLHADFFMPRSRFSIIISNEKRTDEQISLQKQMPAVVFHNSEPSEIAGLFTSIHETVANLTKDNAVLTAREVDVLRGIAAGLTVKEIADRLFISANTVVTHKKNISGKLGIKTVSGLSLYAMMNGYIEMNS